MSMRDVTSLPEGFQDLERFVTTWASATAEGRIASRLGTSVDEQRQFYDASKDRLPEMLDHLDGKDIDKLDDPNQRLYRLVLGFAHAALAAETFGPDEPLHARGQRRIQLTRSMEG
jgi:hypothetical protein